MPYDYLIIGAGSAGAHSAYFLSKEGKRVALVDQGSLGDGASGAAGAFLSPAIGKNNPIQQLINTSLTFALEFYRNLIPEHVTLNGLIRLPKNAEDGEKFQEYAPFIPFDYSWEKGGFHFKNAGILDVIPLLKTLTQSCDLFETYSTRDLHHEDGFWQCGDIRANHLILANGASPFPFEIPYITIRPIWGQRIEVSSTSAPETNLHKKLSISTRRNSSETVAIGATHLRNIAFEPITHDISLDLLTQAQEVTPLEDARVVAEYGGTRAASPDFLPIVGSIIDAEAALKQYPNLMRGQKVPMDDLPLVPSVSLINGLGARGFVYGPYCAKALSDSLIHHTPLPSVIEQSRLFYRWAKRLVQKN